MTRKLFGACLVSLACVAAFGQSNQVLGKWETFTSAEGRFSVLMPGKPEPDKQTADSPIGPYTTNIFIVQGDRQIFLVGWVDYAPGFNFDVQKELEANRDNFLKGVKANLTGATPIKLGTHPGIEFTAETELTVYRSRIYVIGKRPYQLVVASAKGAVASPDADKFFASFKITPDK